MPDLARRFDSNPILRPKDVPPSRADFEITCLLNPGAFTYRGRTGLLMRVAERPRPEEGWVSTPIRDPEAQDGIRIVRIRRDDPDLDFRDPRGFNYKGKHHLTTLSHLRLAWSDDGRKFTAEPQPALVGEGAHETFGVEDCRVTEIEGRYWLTYTAVSPNGVGVGMASTADWRSYTRHGVIVPPQNKDCALFPQKIGGAYFALHRPSGQGLGGNYIWIARSPDLLHWGDHRCLVRTRPDSWDEGRVGAGAAPILTDRGWLEIYHGANRKDRYALAALLLDRDDPMRVLARSREPIMEPTAAYELTGFFGNVVFTNGHVVNGDTVTVYYGASDEVICGAQMSIQEILKSLGIT
jgi:beta-1,2-mannobiose phosphorylase / 1,2-beta-oligomannan phosphorylase